MFMKRRRKRQKPKEQFFSSISSMYKKFSDKESEHFVDQRRLRPFQITPESLEKMKGIKDLSSEISKIRKELW